MTTSVLRGKMEPGHYQWHAPRISGEKLTALILQNVAWITGVNREGERKREHRRKMGSGG